MVVAPRYEIPFVISEVISDKGEVDRCRMLVEATALARAGRFLLRSGSKKRFFVVAIYVDAGMVASRYIVMQTEGSNTAQDNKPVSVHTAVVMSYSRKCPGVHSSEKLPSPRGGRTGQLSARDVQSGDTNQCVVWRVGPG